jgi:hypothetical protein
MFCQEITSKYKIIVKNEIISDVNNLMTVSVALIGRVIVPEI